LYMCCETEAIDYILGPDTQTCTLTHSWLHSRVSRRDYPFHVPVGEESKLTGYIMVEQVKSIDFHARKISHITRATKTTLDEVLSILDSCIY